MTMRHVAAALSLLACLADAPARAQSVAEFYTGKTIHIIEPGSTGGTYNLFAQLASEYLRKLLPGNPAVVLQSVPGMGGTTATNYLANLAPKDGTALGMLIDLAAATQMLQPTAARYDLSKFSVIGSFISDNPILMVRSDTNVRNLADMKQKQVIFGASGRGSQTYVHPALLKEILGANIKIVVGYKGAFDIGLALERNEVQGQSATWISWKARHGDWLRAGKVIPIVQVGLRREADLKDIPLMSELASNDEDRQALEFMSSSSQIGRSLFAPPGVPADRVAALRQAFETMVKDEGFRAVAAKRKLTVNPTSGAEVQAIIQRVLSYPKAVINRASAAAGMDNR